MFFSLAVMNNAAAAVWASLSDCFEQFSLMFPNLCVFD